MCGCVSPPPPRNEMGLMKEGGRVKCSGAWVGVSQRGGATRVMLTDRRVTRKERRVKVKERGGKVTERA